MNLQTVLYCLTCRRLVPHWRRWWPVIGWHYQCVPCEARELQEFETMIKS